MTIVYLCIIAFVLGLTVWSLFREKDWKLQLNVALVIIPLVLRLLLIK